MSSFSDFNPQNIFHEDKMDVDPDPGASQADANRKPDDQGGEKNPRDKMDDKTSTGDGTTESGTRANDRKVETDLAAWIPGMYRVLDLIHEKGTGGLVDKIIIEQNSLGQLVNALKPSAYTSITKVDFSALDEVNIKPVGLYGSRSALVQYLLSKGFLESQHADAMLCPADKADNTSQPFLRSGMYVLTQQSENTVYVLYWPEETSWDDDAPSSVRRNRITFMRYLTKIADQVVCLLSDEHTKAIVWRDEVEVEDEDMEDDDGDRLFAFEVSKTNEQEEGVTPKSGFVVQSPLITAHDPPVDCEVDKAILRPRLATGETEQGIITATYLREQKRLTPQKTEYNVSKLRLQSILKTEVVRLGDTLSLQAVDALLDAGLRHGAGDTVADYKRSRASIHEVNKSLEQARLQAMTGEIDSQAPILRRSIEDVLKKAVDERFPSLIQSKKSAEKGPDAQGGKVVTDQETVNRDGQENPQEGASQEKSSDLPDAPAADGHQDAHPEAVETSESGAATAEKVDDHTKTDGCKIVHGAQSVDSAADREFLINLGRMFPAILGEIKTAANLPKLKAVKLPKYKTLKERILGLDYLLVENLDLAEHERAALVTDVVENGLPKATSHQTGGLSSLKESIKSLVGILVGSQDQSSGPKPVVSVPKCVLEVDDRIFLSRLSSIVDRTPLLAEPASKAAEFARTHFDHEIEKETKALFLRIKGIQNRQCRAQIDRELSADLDKELEQLRVRVLQALSSSMNTTAARSTTTILDLQVSHRSYGSNPIYTIKYFVETHSEPAICYLVYPLELKQDDRHRLQENPDHIPSPQIHSRSAFNFTLPVDWSILQCHLLHRGRCILVVRDRLGDCKIYASTTADLHQAVNGRPVKELKRDKIGENFLMSYDEIKRVLAVCSVSGRDARLQLHTFAFDEEYRALQGMGSPVNLGQWYSDTSGGVSIKHMQFVSGSEEILFVDNYAHARVFSLVTQQFRPATLHLPSVPSTVHATPDGSCLLAIFNTPITDPDQPSSFLRAYHWSSFGSSEGIPVDISPSLLDLDHHIVTSLGSRNNGVYLLGLHPEDHALHSIGLGITSRVTEFTFKEKGGSSIQHGNNRATSHNSIVDVHAQVWTRFPVVPAVRRETIKSSALRQARCLAFVSSQPSAPFAAHFGALIDDFERTTRKPVGDELSRIRVESIDHDELLERFPFELSTFRAGEWLVEFLCLIPIHIAVTKENRFVPIKDGVWSADHERSLLGADVPKIVDSISFGWYESIFQSYMAKKPVKVVSSMGEQSVGKSFALNHLVDTSFAGSAMRTTEGVWMSVTPTEEALIVALDFEGVHSIERSAQEDTLLVLFNTAISNLVLFRNNFALSRDITGLFQSFQSSASVLDPEANPMLFQSTLVIIIKDVVESDKNEIKKEFHLKFQQIVQAEQAMNFITRLHRNRLDIVPWPVIESKQFYTLFKAIKRRLDQQAVTHSGGAIFLQTMKTLMAKLKANDWGAMSQNLATHRAQLLDTLLPNALAFGASEIIPDYEPLTDLDTAAVVEMPDTASRFYIAEPAPLGQPPTREDALDQLRMAWHAYDDRFDTEETRWLEKMQTHLNDMVDVRVEHVRAWVDTNTSKFPQTHADIQGLHRTFDSLAIDLKAGVQLCRTQCTQCKLSCILGRHHDGAHECRTNHRCPRACQLIDGADHDENEPCGLLAGHPGLHLCDVSTHLCGSPCKLSGKRGCQEACVKTVDHDDEHMCAATVHECGKPCSLSNVRTPTGRNFSCDQPCGIASHIPHSEHHCESRQCPIGCQLCKRLCSDHDHLHGLDASAVHLCGQEHACAGLCSAKGICQIETAPQSVEATFTGRHESFQYTKYSQVSKRLPCVIVIPASETKHLREHSHDMSDKPFHHCETRCPDCGYFCTHPLGHTQQEHETSHGSMSKTKWAVDGPDGTVLEVNGRKFGSSDDGAPMLCSMYCQSMGRHAHVDWCRSNDATRCGSGEHEHIATPMQPEPGRAKDWITHSLYWKRTGFKGDSEFSDLELFHGDEPFSTDPYSQEDQVNFAKCDRMCGGPEHNATVHGPAQPSYCTLPILHPRRRLDQAPPGGMGYVSNDGHAFACRNPSVLRQAFHVIFVIDRSGSMDYTDRRPLENTPTSQTIRRSHDNRLGAVFSSLQGFWEARHQAVAAAGGNAGAIRRDAYSVILFNSSVTTAVSHDFRSEPVDLLNVVLQHRASGGTNFTSAIQTARASIESHWSTERAPVIIFLSDGECSIADETMQDLCRRSIALGKTLSFHAVAFGPSTGTLRRMAQIAQDVESRAPPDPLNPHAGVPSSYTEALDTIRLAETFLGIADSLAKPRGALFRG